MAKNQIKTRFAPSPTGYLHIGGVRTALFNYLFSKKNEGLFFLRIDDTDKERSKKEYEEDIVKSLGILGLKWDNQLVRQSERTEIYQKHLEKMIGDGKAYVSEEKNPKEGERTEVIRLKNPNKTVIFEDVIRKKVSFDTTELGDFVIAKSINEPIYHFASVVDDFELGITDIIRAEEHLSNTPRQILIQEAIGAPRPIYAHLPLILASDRSKLSKRQGSVALKDFLEKGYLPEAIINYLALLGWHPENNREIFNLKELTDEFDLSRVQKAGAIWNSEKLDWTNKEYLKKMSPESRLEKYLAEFKKIDPIYTKEKVAKIEPLITERICKFSDLKEMSEKGELSYFFNRPKWKKEEFLWKGEGELKETAKLLKGALEIILKIPTFEKDLIKKSIWPYAEEKGRGSVLWPLRYAMSGLLKSPDPFTLAEILGKEETEERIREAISFIS